MPRYAFTSLAACAALACLAPDTGTGSTGAGGGAPSSEPAAGADPAATAADAAAAPAVEPGAPPAVEPVAPPAAPPEAAKPAAKESAPKKGAKKKAAEPAEPGPPRHLVLTTSRILGPGGRSLARGRVVLASAVRADELEAKRYGRSATADEVAHPEHPIVELAD